MRLELRYCLKTCLWDNKNFRHSEKTSVWRIYETLWAIWYHLYDLKNVKNIGGVLLLAKFQTEACYFSKSNVPPWVFYTFLKLNKSSHIVATGSEIVVLNMCWNVVTYVCVCVCLRANHYDVLRLGVKVD